MKKSSGSIRIIGGSHRSRKITFRDAPGLRPTTDRIRETLFNWLHGRLHGAMVLDLFAGSGALGFEAASRGAAEVTAVESNLEVFRELQNNAETLNLPRVNCVHTTAEKFLQNHRGGFDLVFLDPPFDADTINRISAIMPAFVNSGGLIYREYGHKQQVVPLASEDWQQLKHKKAGQVIFELWQKQP